MAPAACDQPTEDQDQHQDAQPDAPVSDTLGHRIRSLRHAQKLSLSELARLSGVSKGYLSQVERSLTARPSAETVFGIADALGISIDTLFEGGQAAGIRVGDAQANSSLQEFAAEAQLPPADIKMLARIHYRGAQPRRTDDWRYLYESIRRSVDASRRSD